MSTETETVEAPHKSRRGKKAHTIGVERWRVDVREDLAAKTELLLTDPLLGKIAYGARSALVNKLIAQWLAEQGVQV